MLDRYFGLSQQGTDVRTEFIAGVTTFLTMVYIIFVNPIVLGKAGIGRGIDRCRCNSGRLSLIERLFDRQKIAPGKTFLQRAA